MICVTLMKWSNLVSAILMSVCLLKIYWIFCRLFYFFLNGFSDFIFEQIEKLYD